MYHSKKSIEKLEVFPKTLSGSKIKVSACVNYSKSKTLTMKYGVLSHLSQQGDELGLRLQLRIIFSYATGVGCECKAEFPRCYEMCVSSHFGKRIFLNKLKVKPYIVP